MQWDELYSTIKHDRYSHMNKQQRKDFIERVKNMDFIEMQEALVTYFETIESEIKGN